MSNSSSEDKLNICFLGDAAAKHLQRWSKYFANKGHQVHIITFNSNILPDYEPFMVNLVSKRFPNPNHISRFLSLFPMLMNLRKIIKQIKPDIVHVHSASGYAWTAMLTGFHPLMITPWGNDVLIDTRKSKLARFLTIKALHSADLIHCDGSNTKNALSQLGLNEQKIVIETFGTDVEKFRPASRKDQIPSQPHVVISTRYLSPVHDVETFVRAIPSVLERLPNTNFVIVGGGTLKDQLINLSKSMGIFDAVTFAGSVGENEMIERLQNSTIYVSTSTSESGLASSTAEAMACGLPVISTDTGDIRSWVNEGKGGFVIPSGNPQILSEKIVCLLQNNQARVEYGEMNRQAIIDRYNYQTQMAKMESIYGELVHDIH